MFERSHVALWRVVLIPAALITALSHVPVTGPHLKEAHYIGVLFIVLEAASVLVALAVLGSESRFLAGAAAGLAALAIGAYLLTRSVALPEIGDDVGNWTEPLGIVALTAEAAMVLAGLAGWLGWGAALARRTAISVSVLLMAIGVLGTWVADRAEPPSMDMPAQADMG